MLECPDDVWADCLHYYRKDIYEMDGASALRLAFRLPQIVRIEVNVDEPFPYSSTIRFFENRKRDADREAFEADVASLHEIRLLDPTGDGEVVEVTGG